MKRVKVFWCERTGDAVAIEHYWCPCKHSTHVTVGRFAWDKRPEFPSGKAIACEKCGQTVAISSQGFNEIYRRSDTGEEVGGAERVPPGACWAVRPEYAYPKGPDGRTLYVMLPDGNAWCIDGRANNCTMPDDKEHRCWIRTGRPEDGTLDVGKAGGKTCSAGAGSIGTSGYHGFLRKGWLEAC